ncbi:hypothetical protein B6U99_01750 [Candidatus Geothermarchaeota archaeon ex4572_27]|nr:MAG: hypothetical protein B6U99_01750 [Candidatus Geothermarchaeota archaeon ex4572_27]
MSAMPVSTGAPCPLCRGVKLLCGKPRCPVLLEYEVYLNEVLPRLSEEIHGNSPPGVFVGREGYPRVWVGPLVPPVAGDTRIYGSPEMWRGLGLEDILRLSSMLVYGRTRMRVEEARREGRMYLDLLDIAMSRLSPEVEMSLEGRPRKHIVLSDVVRPFGPVANVKSLSIGTIKLDYRIERLASDYDAKAEDAVFELYLKGVPVSAIQRVFSMGALGLRRQRRMVPTRWSITAVDDIIGRRLLEKVRGYPTITAIRVYKSYMLYNRYFVLMIPGSWSYEFLEAWFPDTFWNKFGREPVIYGDWEGFRGRTDYAEVGGCYYAARLAVLEHLEKLRRQATVVVFREVYSGYLFPVGVWSVREAVRGAMRSRPEEFSTLREALKYIFYNLRVPAERWLRASRILSSILHQRSILDYVGRSGL